MDREKLAEALEFLDGRNYLVPWDIDERFLDEQGYGSWLAVTDAARRLLEAEEWRVCKAHRSGNALGFDGKCDAYEAMLLNGTPFTNYCDMVPRLLTDPEETG